MPGVKRLAILGSTGSIGQQALDVVRAFPGKFQVIGLAAGKSLGLLEEQIREFKPRMSYSSAKLDFGYDGQVSSMEEIASHPQVDLVVLATSGTVGLQPLLAALRAGKAIALANKEALVTAGDIVIAEAKRYHGQILPIDSELSAIWQCVRGEKSKPRRLFLTASGGPFYRYSQSQLSNITVEQALRHPTWKMGKKITVDSATLLNKGLEAIEAHWLFGISFDSIEILVHPQSMIHSMVEFQDGSIKAQLGPPDMRLPIEYALSYPERLQNSNFPRLDLTKTHSLTFEPVDQDRFPCLGLALDAGRMGGTYPAALCAADEIAVNLFLQQRLHFTDIAGIIEKVLEQHHNVLHPTLDEVLAAEAWAREIALQVARMEAIC
jgi:1-deoxy-D-xylulose-5-phosphate reductoisomerase